MWCGGGNFWKTNSVYVLQFIDETAVSGIFKWLSLCAKSANDSTWISFSRTVLFLIHVSTSIRFKKRSVNYFSYILNSDILRKHFIDLLELSPISHTCLYLEGFEIHLQILKRCILCCLVTQWWLITWIPRRADRDKWLRASQALWCMLDQIKRVCDTG